MRRRAFIRRTSAYGLLLPCNKMASSMLFTGMQYEGNIKEQSIAAFKRFEAVWNFNDFWKRGNTFDACLNLQARKMINYM